MHVHVSREVQVCVFYMIIGLYDHMFFHLLAGYLHALRKCIRV